MDILTQMETSLGFKAENPPEHSKLDDKNITTQ